MAKSSKNLQKIKEARFRSAESKNNILTYVQGFLPKFRMRQFLKKIFCQVLVVPDQEFRNIRFEFRFFK